MESVNLDNAIGKRGLAEVVVLEAALDHCFDGIIVFDLSLNCIFWNRFMELLTGLGRGEVLGRSILSLTFINLINNEKNFCEALEESNTWFRDKMYSLPGDTSKRTFDICLSELSDEIGQRVAGLVIVQDTSEIRETEQKIRESEKRFRIMADNAPVALWMARTDSLCEFFNQGWLLFTGRTQEQEFGVGWTEGIHPEDFQRTMDTYIDAFNARDSFSMEYRLKRHDGQYRWIQDTGVPRYSPDGMFMGYIGSCVDFTEKKSALEDLSNMVVKLQDAIQIRDDFLAVASHELRTPITPLKIQVQALKRHWQTILPNVPQTGQFSKALESSGEQVERLEKLVDDLLDVSRITAGRLTLNLEDIDLVTLIQGVIGRFQAQIQESHVELKIQFPSSVFGRWDFLRIEQMFTNLLSNALKYGSGKPIEVSIQIENEKVRLVIQDQGIGIPLAAQKRIFNRFERAVSLKTFGGLGLGLYITQQIVAAHGGTITVESSPGKGAKFSVELPLSLATNQRKYA